MFNMHTAKAHVFGSVFSKFVIIRHKSEFFNLSLKGNERNHFSFIPVKFHLIFHTNYLLISFEPE